MIRSPLAFLVLLAGAGACSQPFAAEGPDGGTIPSDASSQGGAVFQTCPGGYSGACAKIAVPLDWNAPNGASIEVLVDKIASSARPKAQIWVLQGGPGGTAADMVPIARSIARELPDVEVLSLEHRGVGASHRLGCPLVETELESRRGADAGAPDTFLHRCFEEAKATYGGDLAFYTTTNAARDLAYVIDRVRRPDAGVFVYGVSYGTYWLQRYLQVAPTQATGVVLDSILSPGELFSSKFDEQADPVAQRLAELCKEDAACSASMGPDPWAKIVAAKAKLDSGHCAESGLTAADRILFTNFLRPRPTMAYALAVWHRLDRCNETDVAALKRMRTRLPFGGGPNDRLSSAIVNANVIFSELWESPAPALSTIQQREDAVVFPAGAAHLATEYDAWPKYPRDEFVGRYPTTTIPVLLLNGTLDSQTPIEAAERTKTHYTAEHQTLVTIPNANHGVIHQSPMATAPGAPQRACGFEIIVSFFENPTAPPDTSCLGSLAAVPFAPPSEELDFFFGTSDLWMGAPASAPTRPWGGLAEIERAARMGALDFRRTISPLTW